MPGFSLELCGGTHAASTGSIGVIRLVQERGVAAGTRRLEALTGEGAIREAREQSRVLTQVQSALNVERATVPDILSRVLEQNRSLQRGSKLKVTLPRAPG